MSNETVTYSLEAVLTRIEGKIDTLQKDVNQKVLNLYLYKHKVYCNSSFCFVSFLTLSVMNFIFYLFLSRAKDADLAKWNSAV